MVAHNISTAADVPYSGQDDACSVAAISSGVTVESYTNVTAWSGVALATALLDGPVAV